MAGREVKRAEKCRTNRRFSGGRSQDKFLRHFSSQAFFLGRNALGKEPPELLVEAAILLKADPGRESVEFRVNRKFEFRDFGGCV
jgi:hypothetical protein